MNFINTPIAYQQFYLIKSLIKDNLKVFGKLLGRYFYFLSVNKKSEEIRYVHFDLCLKTFKKKNLAVVKYSKHSCWETFHALKACFD
jgi:hypothetical protein